MKLFCLAAACLLALGVRAEMQTQTVDYKQGDTVLEGFLAHDTSVQGRRPGVLIIHQWKGLTDYEKKRAEMLAKMGYNVFALDIYGKGVRPQSSRDAGAEASKFKQNRQLFRDRAQAGLDVLKKHPLTDPSHVAAIGYCFGGTGVLELARNGADVRGVVSFHGGLDSPNPADGAKIRCKVLALHGADDPHVPAKDVEAFKQEMRQGKVDWQLVEYGGAVHSFTDWNAGDNVASGAAYNERADRRSWQAMKDFFEELFK